MIQIYVAMSEPDAQLVVAELRAAGITGVLQRDVVGYAAGPFPTVWVYPEDEREARRVLNEIRGEDDGKD